MQQQPWPGSALSLDQVVRRAAVGAGHREGSHQSAGASTSVLFASAHLDTVAAVATAASVSQLAADGSAQTTALTQTATVQALQALCRSFVARCAAGGEAGLAADTAWWSGEAARLHAANAGGELTDAAAAAGAPPSASPGWSDFMRQASEVLESTHHIAAVRRQEDATATPSVSQRPRPDAAADVNVLQLGSSGAVNGAWESLEMLESTELGNGVSSSSPAMHRDDAALRAVEAAVRGGATRASEEAEVLGSLAYLLKVRPELIAQHEDSAELQRWLMDCLCRHADPGWADAALALFHALPPRSQLDFTYTVIAALSDEPRTSAGAATAHTHVLRLLQRVLAELHQVWLPLLDSEVTELFVRLVDEVLVPFAALFDEVDPSPLWLSQWASRPSFVLTMDTLIRNRPDLVHALTEELPHVHAAVVLLIALPLLSLDAAGAPAPAPVPWQDLFRRFLRLLCGEPLTAPAALEVAAHRMGLCVGKLTPADKADVFEAASAAMRRWSPAEASPQRNAQFVFALRLLTRLLVEPGGVEPWCSSPMWQVVDTQLFAKTRALVQACQERPPLPAPKLFVASTLDVVTVVRRCWARLLRAHADRLPQALATSVRDVWGASPTPAKGSNLLRCRELVQMSTTLPGWAALRPHVAAAAGATTHAAAHWADLLAAIVDVGGGAGAAPLASPTPAAATPRRPGKPRRRSHSCLRILTPRGVALLLRWATCAAACDGLCEAARAASVAFLRTTAHAAHRRTRWPLLWPVETYPSAGPADLSAAEDAFDHASATRAGACYQSVHLLLRAVMVSSSNGDDATFFEESWGQLTDLWLAPAQLSSDAPVPERPVNRPPFGEASLLTLLATTALCVLARPAVEFRAWFDPVVAEPRIRQLRRLCEERRGVDPVYFMVRFITSGKGRKRLPAILLDGAEAELTVDTVCDVDSFTDGEALPAGDLASAGCTAQEAQELLMSALGPSPMSSLLAADTNTAAAGTACPSDPVVKLVRALLANRAALRVTAMDVEQCLARRDAEEWACFADTDTRVLAVCALLEQQYPACVAMLTSGHMDVVFLVNLCLRSWVELPPTHSTPARRKLCWTALQYFCDHGVAAYDGLIARSIAAHVEKSQRECAGVVKEAVVFPVSRPLPLPSALFVLLLVRPFALTAC